MNPLLTAVAACRSEGNLDRLTAVIPYVQLLGVRAEARDGELVCIMPFSETLVGNPTLPALHGGTLGALAESSAIFELLWRAETDVLPKTINITVSYLRSARPIDTYAAATITRQGRRVANVEVTVWQEDRDRPVATAHAHFLVMSEGD